MLGIEAAAVIPYPKSVLSYKKYPNTITNSATTALTTNAKCLFAFAIILNKRTATIPISALIINVPGTYVVYPASKSASAGPNPVAAATKKRFSSTNLPFLSPT